MAESTDPAAAEQELTLEVILTLTVEELQNKLALLGLDYKGLTKPHLQSLLIKTVRISAETNPGVLSTKPSSENDDENLNAGQLYSPPPGRRVTSPQFSPIHRPESHGESSKTRMTFEMQLRMRELDIEFAKFEAERE